MILDEKVFDYCAEHGLESYPEGEYFILSKDADLLLLAKVTSPNVVNAVYKYPMECDDLLSIGDKVFVSASVNTLQILEKVNEKKDDIVWMDDYYHN